MMRLLAKFLFTIFLSVIAGNLQAANSAKINSTGHITPVDVPISRNIVLTLSGIPNLGTFYESSIQSGSPYLLLKKYKQYNLTARTIGLTSPEYGHTWLNRTALNESGNDEDITTAGVATMTLGTGGQVDWNLTVQTAPFRYKAMFGNFNETQALVTRIASDGASSNQQACIALVNQANAADFAIVGVGWDANVSGGSAVIESNIQGTVTSVPITTAQRNAGIWIKITRSGGGIQHWYSLLEQATPPDSSQFILLKTLALFNVTWDLKVGEMLIGSAAGSFTGKFLYFDDTYWFSSEISPPNPLWGAQGYATTNPEIKLVGDYDLGSAAPTLDQAAARNALIDALNQIRGDSAVWTFAIVQSDTLAITSGGLTFQTASAVTIQTSGTGPRPYVTIFAKVASNGLQFGSLRFPIIINVNPS